MARTVVVATARATMMAARATVTGAKKAMATMATMATTATTAMMATMATMMLNGTVMPNSDKDNKDQAMTTMKMAMEGDGCRQSCRGNCSRGCCRPQDATIVPTAALWWRLCHHTVDSHRIDSTWEYIANLEQTINKSGPGKKSGLGG